MRSFLLKKPSETFPNSEKTRKYLTIYQRQILEKRFQINPYLQKQEGHQLSTLLNVTKSRIEQWFISKRRHTKRKVFICAW